MPTNGIYWLASYPKSGNTWFRIVLATLLNPSSAAFELNDLATGAVVANRAWAEEALGFESSLLPAEDLDELRPDIHAWHARNRLGYHKTHDAFTSLEKGTPLFSFEGSLGALYFIRNPLDVAISLANHLSCSIDQAIAFMGNDRQIFCRGQFSRQLQMRQWLSTWSAHVESWAGTKDIPVLVIRYEDMKASPFSTFTRATDFLGLKASSSAIERALEISRLEKLQEQEASSGFREKPLGASRFFRKGMVGEWREVLTPTQVEQVVRDHAGAMAKFGYLDENLRPV